MTLSFSRCRSRLLIVVSVASLLACEQRVAAPANPDRQDRDARPANTARDAASDSLDAGPPNDAAFPVDAASQLGDGRVPIGALLGDADIVPVVVTATPLPTPVCSVEEAWGGELSTEDFPADAVRLLAVAAKSGTRVFALDTQSAVPHDAGLLAPGALDSGLLDTGVLDTGVAGDGAAEVTPDSGARPPEYLLIVDGEDTTRVEVPWTFDLEAGVAIHPDGLQLVLVARGHAGLLFSARERVGAAFDAPAAGAFARINGLGAQGGARFSSPVWSASGERVYVSEGEAASTPLQLQLQDGYFWVEARLDHAGLEDVRVTSASTDDLTLFTWSQALGEASVYRRERIDLAFGEPQSLDIDYPVHVDVACETLSYERPCDPVGECNQVVVQASD